MSIHTGTTKDGGQFNLVETALNYLTNEQRDEIVRQHLRSEVREVVKRRAFSDAEVVLSSVAEKLQRRMNAMNAGEFHQKLYDATGIDARKPDNRASKFPVDTLQDILKLAEFEVKAQNRKERH